MNEDALRNKLADLIADMAHDYDRFSQSGKATYDQICSIMNQLLGG